MGGVCLLASIKRDWFGFALHIVLVIVFVILVLALKEPITAFLY
jgi:hypothetical protein